jgi:hypothetical protein
MDARVQLPREPEEHRSSVFGLELIRKPREKARAFFQIGRGHGHTHWSQFNGRRAAWAAAAQA